MSQHTRVLFVGAMDREIDGLLRALDAKAESALLGCYPQWTARQNSTDVTIVQTHVGDVNAAIATTAAITVHRPTAVFKFGCVGGHSAGIHTGDVVVPSHIFHSGAWIVREADATRWQPVFGDLPYQVNRENLGGRDAVLKADETLTSAWAQHVKTQGMRVVHAHIGSSNMWFFDHAHMTHVLDANLPDAPVREWAADMESYAVAQACTVAGVSFTGIHRAANNEFLHEPYEPRAVAALFVEPFITTVQEFVSSLS
ncbi:MAG: hypothetical protein NTZ50_03260 [Chloroflexi bacterium]|nr:hypothetical protein [Chloroflexota bacterium]